MTRRLALPLPAPLASRVHAQKNCVAVIESLSAVLARSTLSARDAERVAVLGETASRLKGLLLDEVSEGLVSEGEGSVDLSEVAARVARELEAPLGGRVELKAEMALILGDARLIEEAVRNVALNAAQAAPEGSVVSIRTRCLGEACELTVVNDDGDHAPGSGTGLGLPIARRIVASHLGTLTARRIDGQVVVVLRFACAER